MGPPIPKPAQAQLIQSRSKDEPGLVSAEEAEKGMEEMSRVYNEGGRELYIGAGDRD